MAMNMSQRFNEFAEKVDALQFVFSGKNFTVEYLKLVIKNLVPI